jgi:aldehyde dehydrogenase (NAD+)
MKISSLAADMRKDIYDRGYPDFKIRKERLLALRDCIKKNESAIISALVSDLGKSDFEAYATEVGFILDELRFVLKHFESWLHPRKVRTPLTLFPGKSYIFHEPFGAVLIISPWNYPFQLCLSPLIGAFAAGNKIVLKPSEMAGETARMIELIISEVFEEREVCVVQGGIEETQLLLQQKWDHIFFTGSTMVGKIVMKAAAEHLTPVTLELGGKTPLLIDESADLDLAAKRCAWGKFMNAGQTCVAPDYVLVPKKLEMSFLGKMKKHLELFYGVSIKESHDYSRIINKRHLERLRSLIEPGQVHFGGEIDEEKKYLAPTILRHVSWSDKIMEEEIFGPILPILTYENLEEVLHKILELPKPLAFYFFSQNIKTQKKVLDLIPFGGGCVNDTVVHLANPNLPFGGVGPSGMGSYHGKKTFETFSHQKSVFIQKNWIDLPIRYPPYKGKLRWLKFFLR